MTPAADDFDVIRARIDALRAEAVRHCPIVRVRTLYDCLRSPTPCSSECPHRGDWLGPESNA